MAFNSFMAGLLLAIVIVLSLISDQQLGPWIINMVLALSVEGGALLDDTRASSPPAEGGGGQAVPQQQGVGISISQITSCHFRAFLACKLSWRAS